MPIDLLPRHAEEKRSRSDLPTVIGKVGNLNGPVANDPALFSYRGKRVQSHGGDCRPGIGCPSGAAASCFSPHKRSRPAANSPGEKPSKREGHPIPGFYSCGTPKYGSAKAAILPNAGAATEPP